MSLRTPLSRAKGLGSAKDGTGHWLAERASAVALLPLLLYVVIGLILYGGSYETAVAWIAHPVSAVALVLFLIVMFQHAQLGMQVVYEDYIQSDALKVVSIYLTKFVAYALAAIGSFAVLKIAFGS